MTDEDLDETFDSSGLSDDAWGYVDEDEPESKGPRDIAPSGTTDGYGNSGSTWYEKMQDRLTLKRIEEGIEAKLKPKREDCTVIHLPSPFDDQSPDHSKPWRQSVEARWRYQQAFHHVARALANLSDAEGLVVIDRTIHRLMNHGAMLGHRETSDVLALLKSECFLSKTGIRKYRGEALPKNTIVWKLTIPEEAA